MNIQTLDAMVFEKSPAVSADAKRLDLGLTRVLLALFSREIKSFTFSEEI